MKLANPLYYPLPVFIGAIALVLGVRVARLPNIIVLPASGAIATVGAALRKSQEPEQFDLDNPVLARELHLVREQAAIVAAQAEVLQTEATRLLTNVHEVELFGIVQYACDRARDLPSKIDQLARRMKGTDSLLSVDDLQQQLQGIEAKIQASSGIAQEQLRKLADILQRNIQLAQEGQDTRQAQVVNLSALILEAAGVLQQLQNKLRSADLNDASQTNELRSLSAEFTSVQDNLNVLIADNAQTAIQNGMPASDANAESKRTPS